MKKNPRSPSLPIPSASTLSLLSPLHHTSLSSWFQQTIPTNQILLHEHPRRIPPRKPSAIERAFLHALRLPISFLLLSHLHQNRPRKPKAWVVHHIGRREPVHVLVGLQRKQRANDSLSVPRSLGNPLDMMGGIAKGKDVVLPFEILYDELVV